MCCRQVAIAKMVQFLGARRVSLREIEEFAVHICSQAAEQH